MERWRRKGGMVQGMKIEKKGGCVRVMWTFKEKTRMRMIII